MNKEKNFKTEKGLKVRLDPLFFMQKFHDDKEYYTQKEMVDDDKMYTAVGATEIFYQMPAIFTFVLSVVCCFIKIPVYQYGILYALFYTFGYVYFLHPRPKFLRVFFFDIGQIYNLIWFLPYVVFVVIALITKNAFMILPYFGFNLLFYIINNCIFNSLVRSFTKKKYDRPFNDTEMCAFQNFHYMLVRTDKVSNLIREYLEFEKEENNQ